MNSDLKWTCYKSLDEEDNLVGVKFSKNEIKVYFPLGYQIPQEKNKQIESVIDLLKTISLCKKVDNTRTYNYAYGDEEELPINSYLWILNDYLNNGLYSIKAKKYISNQIGKINWKRTYKTKPIFSDNEIIYLNPIVEQSKSYDNIITEIQVHCINISIRMIGWLFGNIEYIDGYYRSNTTDGYLDLLNRELSKTYDDRNKELLHHLIKILSNLSNFDSLDNINDILVSNYHYAWEKMISEVFGNDNSNIKKYFPKIEWNLKYDKNPNPKMRPDTVIKKSESLYILDGKYYQYAVVENGRLPGAEDVDKQITYGEFGSKIKDDDGNLKYKEIHNAFIIPFNCYNNRFNFSPEEKIVDVGYVTSNARESELHDDFRKVAIILIDTKYLIDCYLRKEKKDEQQLISSICESIKTS